jgi:enolase
VNSFSYASVLLRSQVLSLPPYQIFGELAEHKGDRNIQCMVNCLHGGKAIGSKCKVFKYFLVARNVTEPTVLQTVLQAIRKGIVSGKGGEAALKYSSDGTFVCPMDTINDNFKIVEDAINASGAKESLGIGLSWQADTLFAADTKKYES